ncbi:hypothetical protein NDU88_002389 [Pleurodeles waltl]|uniref:Uncharacterized protein n=1 Tax=Pleurodeles waltl TaxID=8319 RepID=A0AAV7WPC1_PLEWA|nr:hypothetical protein NDU88_002389 [Pleurodeles waltl]
MGALLHKPFKGPLSPNSSNMSRELETLATSHVKAGTECRSPEPCERDSENIGNPHERIPDPLPEIQGEEDASAITGIPYIQVPEVLERDNGLHARARCLQKPPRERTRKRETPRKEEGRQTHRDERRRKNREAPVQGTPQREKKVLKDANSAMSPEGRGSTSRELETAATSHVKAGTECHSPEPCERDSENIGNPDERIPDPLPEIQGEEDASAITGNPDIRVPEVLERDNGLHARGVLFTEAAEGEDTEEGDAEKRGRIPNPLRQTQEEEQRSPSPGDTTTGKEGPEGRELCHVPGGTWLNQGRSCLQAKCAKKWDFFAWCSVKWIMSVV